MKVAEFQAWFEGFTEAIPGIPNEKQWERIKEKVAAINCKPIVMREYIDRLNRNTCVAPNKNTGAWTLGGSVNHKVDGFDSVSAMYALGKLESDEFKTTS